MIIRNYYAFANSFNINYYSSAQKYKAQCIIYICIYISYTHIYIIHIVYKTHTHSHICVWEKEKEVAMKIRGDIEHGQIFRNLGITIAQRKIHAQVLVTIPKCSEKETKYI